MGRRPCCAKENVNRGAWTAMEDGILTKYVAVHGQGKWADLSKKAGLNRCGKSCRLRWLNYLRPDIKRGNITDDEDELIIRLHKLLGNRWSVIAGRLSGRTDNEIKNHWNTNLCKKAAKDPEPSKILKPNDSFPNQCYNNPKLQMSSTTMAPPITLVRTKAPRSATAFVNPQQMKNNAGDCSDHEPISAIFTDLSVANLKQNGNNSGETMVPDLSNDLNMGETWLSEILDSDLSSFLEEFGLENGILNSELLPATSNLADPAMSLKEKFSEI